MEPRARQPDQHAAQDPGRSRAARDHPGRARPGDPGDPEPPADTKYVKHERIRSERLSKFWGRDMYLGAHVLLPEGWDTHPQAKLPAGRSTTATSLRTSAASVAQPPDQDLKCEFSDRFQLDCYNRIVQEHAHQFYKDWTGPGFPRVLLIEIQHANPYYDDSYAVNSANLGPYGDAITYELIPYLEKKYRGHRRRLGALHVRRLDRRLGGDGRAGLLPGRVQRRLDRLPRSHRLPRLHAWSTSTRTRTPTGPRGPWKRVARPAHRDYLGHLSATIEQANRFELVIGDEGPLGRTVGHLGGGLLARRRGRLPAAHLGQDDRRHRQVRWRRSGGRTTT